MLTTDILDRLTTTTFASIRAFLPEMLICAAIVFMLLLRLFRGSEKFDTSVVALAFSAVALLVGLIQWGVPKQLFDVDIQFDAPDAASTFFGGMVAFDWLALFLRLLLMIFAVLMILLSLTTGIPDTDDSADFYTLLLGGTLGMMFMASANHLLMVFLAVEMASLPSYALSGFLKGRRQGSEAALKYVVYGGGASGVMLYGISLLAGRFGTGSLPDLAAVIRAQAAVPVAGTVGAGGIDSIVLLGMLLTLVGLAFKLSVVPFHFWCPDVFEGAAAEVGAFLSVASKAAAMALTGRLLLLLVGQSDTTGLLPRTIGPVLAIFAAITATFGNLAAYPQTNLKRLLAYSTIAHAGYMLMGLATLTADGAAAVLFYLAAYLFMNLGAFAIVAYLRNLTGSEDLSAFRGLVYRSPMAVILLGVFMLSLLGLPPLAGFAAKFQVFAALFHAGQDYMNQSSPTLGYTMYGLLLVGGINTAISAFYYLKVMKVMILDKPLEEVEGREVRPLKLALGATVFGLVLGSMVFVIGLAWNPLAVAADRGIRDFDARRGSVLDAPADIQAIGAPVAQPKGPPSLPPPPPGYKDTPKKSGGPKKP
jgi:NADH-quinone oxidoreductase subunit N